MILIGICEYCHKQKRLITYRTDMCDDCSYIYNQYITEKARCTHDSVTVPSSWLIELQEYYKQMNEYGYKVPKDFRGGNHNEDL